MKTYTSIFICLWVFLASTLEVRSQCAACEHSVDVVVNGNFNGGNSGFTSTLDYVTGLFGCPLCPEDTYTIGANAVFYHSGFNGSDHTNPPFGNFFIANGPGMADVNVWCENLSVIPNTEYTFTFWARDVTNNSNDHPYAMLQVSFNGELVNDTLVADGGWEQYSTTWNSGPSNSLELCIVNQQSLTGGNDFGLDDISLTGCQPYILSQPAYAGEDATICSNVAIQLGQPAINGYAYSWDNSYGLSSISSSDPELVVQNVGPGSISQTYIVTRDSANVGCIESDTVTVIILEMPSFSLGSDVIICPGESIQLNAGNGWDDILWSTNETSQIITSGPGNFFAEVSFGSCTEVDSINVAEEMLPDVDLGPDLEICLNTPLTLDVGVVGTWSDNSVSDTLQVFEGGEYYFSYSQNTCTASDTVLINAFIPPVLILPADTSFCEGTVLELDAGMEGLWNTGVLSSSISVNTDGYFDIVAENGPCKVNAGTHVQMLYLPQVNLGNDTTVCEDSPVEFVAFSEFNDTYSWSTGDSVSSFTAMAAGNYSVVVSNECGVTEDEVWVETYPCASQIFIPSAFTPNDDEINEGWLVQGYNVSNVRISVYNRFGDRIFFAKDLGIPWYPGTGIGDDVYNYLVEATAFDGSSIRQHGNIYLLR